MNDPAPVEPSSGKRRRILGIIAVVFVKRLTKSSDGARAEIKEARDFAARLAQR